MWLITATHFKFLVNKSRLLVNQMLKMQFKRQTYAVTDSLEATNKIYLEAPTLAPP